MFKFRRGGRMCAIVAVTLAVTLSAGCTPTGPGDQPDVGRADDVHGISPQEIVNSAFETHWEGMTSKSEGWFIGSPGVALGRSENYIYLTHDGGKTWEETGNVNDTWARMLNCGGFADAQTGYLCFRYDIENIGPVYQTRDGGKTWNRLAIAPLIALVEEGSGVGEIRQIAFGEAGEVRMTAYYRTKDTPGGHDGEGAAAVFVSKDNGHTWTGATAQ